MGAVRIRTAAVVVALISSVIALVPSPADAATVTLTLASTIQTNPFVGTSVRMSDGEGSAYVPSDDSLWLIDDVSGRLYEVGRSTGVLKKVITNAEFQSAVQLGGTATAGKWRAGDLEAVAYDARTDTLFAFSGKCCTSSELPTVYRLRRDTNGKFAIESFQPLPSGSDWTGAAWTARDGKLYVGVNADIRSYDYVTNTVGNLIRIPNLGGIYGMGFTADGNELFVVSATAKLFRIDWITKSVEPGWVIDLKPFGIGDARAVEAIGNQVYVLDGYDSRSSSDPLKYAVYVLNMPASTVPVASFSATPTSGTAPLDVAFTDTSTNNPTSWSWSFGDGTTSTAQNPLHTYSAAGTYSVTLTATNASGSGTTTSSSLITVSSAPVPDTSITSGPAPLTNSASATFTFTSDKVGATFTCSLDGAAATPCSSPLNVGPLGEGAHGFAVQASTPVGGTDPTPAKANWTIDLTAPTATPVAPAADAVDVPVTESPTVEFSEPVDPSTVTADKFTLVPSGGGTPVTAAVSYDAATRRAVLDPASALAAGTSYTANVSGGVRDVAGNALAAAVSWTFTTRATAGIRLEGTSTVVNSTATNTVTIPTPAGTKAGDVLIASLALNGSAVAANGVPAGWTPIATVTGIANPRIFAYVRVAGDAEPASFTWTLASSVASGAGIARYSGVDRTTPLDGLASTATGASSTTATVPGVSTTSANAVLVGGIALNTSSSTITITSTSGMTAAWDIAGKRNELADQLVATAGPTGSRSWQFSASREWASYLVALRPA